MQQQEQPPSSLESLKAATNWMALFCRVMATTVEVFLHDQFGERYIGSQGALAIPLILLFMVFCQGQDCRPLLLFLAAYLLVCFLIRIETTIRRWRGTLPAHSRYNGRPLLMKLFPRLPEIKVKRLVEPLIVLVTGIAFLPHNRPLGAYLVISAFALSFSVTMCVAQDRVRAMDMNDSVIEQTEVAERFRDMNRN